MNKHKISSFTKIISVLIFIPFFVFILTKITPPFKVETNNDWIGFYSGYFGSIIGVLGVYLVTRLDQKQRESERKDELFFDNIFEINIPTYVKSIDDMIEYPQLPRERVDKVINIICDSTQTKLSYGENIEIAVSKEKLKEGFKNDKGITDDDIDIIYKEVYKFESTEYWQESITERDEMLSSILNLKEHIDRRIERLLIY